MIPLIYSSKILIKTVAYEQIRPTGLRDNSRIVIGITKDAGISIIRMHNVTYDFDKGKYEVCFVKFSSKTVPSSITCLTMDGRPVSIYRKELKSMLKEGELRYGKKK